MANPCGWAISSCACGLCWDANTPTIRDRAEALAVGLMWAATGRQFGVCQSTVLPVNPRPTRPLYETFPVTAPYGGDGGGGLSFWPVLDSGQWRNMCAGSCGCSGKRCEVPLPGPVVDILEVLVDGEVVDPAAYLVYGDDHLARVDGDCWPVCQRFDTELPGFEVTYTSGREIPADVQAAAELLGCEYAASLTGGQCRLPGRLASLTRQGVEVTIAQAAPSDSGVIRTGIQMVDDAIAAHNPYGLIQPPEIWSPDLPEVRTVRWRAGS